MCVCMCKISMDVFANQRVIIASNNALNLINLITRDRRRSVTCLVLTSCLHPAPLWSPFSFSELGCQWCLFQPAQCRTLLAPRPLSIILTTARSSLQACCSIFWQEIVLHFLYGLLPHCSPALVISILLQALLCYPICLLQMLDIFWWQWSIFFTPVLISSHFCLSLISWGTAYRKMNYTTQRARWLFCSQLEANLARQGLAAAWSWWCSIRWPASILQQLCFHVSFHSC